MADPDADKPGQESASTGSPTARSAADEAAEEAAFQAEVKSVRRKMALGILGLGAASVLGCWGVCIGYPCFSTGFSYGMWLDQCPSSDLRLGMEAGASGLLRGGKGELSVHTFARYLEGEGAYASELHETMHRGYEVRTELRDVDGNVVQGARFTELEPGRRQRHYEVELPKDLADGDYVLAVTSEAPFETLTTEIAVPLYAPAIAHLATDRPLYKPGQEVKLRSVLLKRTDLTPLDKRPGRWTITSPTGDQMLVEKDRAGVYGVADTTFPLDARAEIGTWTATYSSGGVQDQVRFDVRPFQLPRFSVELASAERWYGIGDEVVITGTARYTSGAPVANAPVVLTLRVSEGRWPMPLEWEEPFEAKTDAYGRFEVTVGEVPADLIELSRIRASAQVTEEAGTVIRGGTTLILSVDDLVAEAVTELGDGLVGGFNNRAYLRVSTPDGRPVRNARVEVWPAHDPTADRKVDEADVDGVASIQLDPGDPITVVIPAAPVRVRPFEPDPPSVSSGFQLPSGSSLSLAERRALDTAVPAVARCGDFALGGRSVGLGVRVNPFGNVTRVVGGDSLAETCVAQAMRSVRFPSGDERTYNITWSVSDSLRPWLTADVRSVVGDPGPVRTRVEEAIVEARRCMPFGSGSSGAKPVEAHWTLTEGSRFVDTRVVSSPAGTGLTPAQVSCVAAAIARVQLAEPARADAMGTSVLSLNTPRTPGMATSRPMTRTAYELAVAASVDGAEMGDTTLVLDPGRIPAMRLRATPSLAKPGDQVIVDLLRGPDWRGGLPEELYLMEGSAQVAKAKVDQDKKQVVFELPDDVDGFLHVDYGGARAVIFVRPDKPLAVALATDKEVYRPGEEAVITVTTTAGESPTSAGVGLMGVDSTLAQLATLLGPDEWGRVTVRATADRPAFGAFDPRALTLGQVRGDNAAKAAVLRISQLPMDYAGDEAVFASGSASADDLELLTRNFYRALVELHDAVGAWEDAAKDDAILTNDDMARLWKGVIDGMAKTEEPAVDAFGRPLALELLPEDLLAQCDPRQVVSDATHLPEDIEQWTTWVRTQGRGR
ncbi:MAG: hypothetical protein EP330_09210 [Deltaproteobacteria bacterium]|nr:MAG: hypothetical protein EP330_09210 [Deltaproteobacteria bacterium]